MYIEERNYSTINFYQDSEYLHSKLLLSVNTSYNDIFHAGLIKNETKLWYYYHMKNGSSGGEYITQHIGLYDIYTQKKDYFNITHPGYRYNRNYYSISFNHKTDHFEMASDGKVMIMPLSGEKMIQYDTVRGFNSRI